MQFGCWHGSSDRLLKYFWAEQHFWSQNIHFYLHLKANSAHKQKKVINQNLGLASLAKVRTSLVLLRAVLVKISTFEPKKQPEATRSTSQQGGICNNLSFWYKSLAKNETPPLELHIYSNL